MKISSHLFAGIVGAIIAGFCSTQWLQHQRPPEQSTPDIVVAPIASPPPTQAVAHPAELEQATRKNNELSTQLAEARERLAATDSLLAETRASLDELRRPMSVDMLSSTLSAQLKSGEAVVTGGYPLPDGKRLYAFITPTIQNDNGKDVVHIEGRVLAVTDQAGTAAGLDNLATNAANTIQHGEVWIADEQAAVLSTLGGAADTDSLIYPSITLRSGGNGLIEMNGLTLKVSPTVGADHETMDLMVRMEQLPQPAEKSIDSPENDGAPLVPLESTESGNL